MGWLRCRGIAFKLSLLVLSGVTLVITLILGFNYHLSRRLMTEKIEENAFNLARATANRLNTLLKAAEKIPAGVAQTINELRPNRQELNNLLKNRLAGNPELFGIAVAFEDVSGRGRHSVGSGQAEPHQADRLLRGAASRAGDAGDAHGHVGSEVAQRALGHLEGRLLAHGAELLQRGGAHAQQRLLGLVGVRNDAPDVVVGASGHARQQRAYQATCARLRSCHSRTALARPVAQGGRSRQVLRCERLVVS